MAEEKLDNNPFRKLNSKQFPEKVFFPGYSKQEEKKRVSKQRKHLSPDEAKDLAFFLRAMDGVEPEKEHGHAVKGANPAKRMEKKSGSFAMKEHCDMDSVRSMTQGVTPLPRKEGGVKGKLAQKDEAKTAAPAASPSNKTGKALKKSAKMDRQKEREMSMAELLSSADTDPSFSKAMQGVVPLNSNGREVAPPTAILPGTAGKAGDLLREALEGKLEFALSFSEEYMEGHVMGLDELIMNKLRHGAFSPENNIDLHGLNVQQAFEALRGFLKSSWYRGIRCVIVVPGRGKNSPDGVGILREKLKSWFVQEPFKRLILAFCTARPCDGGAGSVYVLLRKYKKKGKIYWDRMPADEDLL